jgi:hypothetical protein
LASPPAASPPPAATVSRFAKPVYFLAAFFAVVAIAMVVVAIGAGVGWFAAARPLVGSALAGNAATFVVAGVTLLLADSTALLAWFTRQSIEATRREAKIAEDSLVAIREQTKVAQDQVDATNRQAGIAQAQLTASWRPLLRELSPLTTPSLDIRPGLDGDFGFQVRFENIGRGPAFVKKATLWLVAGAVIANRIVPEIVEPDGEVLLNFGLSPGIDGVARSIAAALSQGQSLWLAVSYHDIARSAAWQSKALLVKQSGTFDWTLSGTTISEIPVKDLD